VAVGIITYEVFKAHTLLEFGRLINAWHRPFFSALQNAPEAGPLGSGESMRGGMVQKKEGAHRPGAAAPPQKFF
jgi:hypothetical protein